MERFDVTPEYRRQEFLEALENVKKDFITMNCTSERPKFILVGGQPGSGKTALVQAVINTNPNTKFVVIDLDEYRKYHPDFDEIRKNHRSNGVILTNSFAFAIENAMLEYVQENRLNAINVTTLRNTEMIENTVKTKLIPKGFKVEAYIMAVSPEESYFSALNRYNEQKSNTDVVTRFTSKEFHDEAYKKLNDTIKKLLELNIPVKIAKRANSKELPAEIIQNSQADVFRVMQDIRCKSRNKVLKNLTKYKVDLSEEDEVVMRAYLTFFKELNKYNEER